MANKSAKFRPGTQYQDILAAMSDEERTEHLENKRKERALKKLIGQKLEAKADEISESLMGLAFDAISNAKENKEEALNTFSQLYDRFHGKTQDIDITSAGEQIPLMNVRVAKTDDDG